MLVPQRGGRGAAPPPQRAEGAAVQGAARRRAPARGHDRADVEADTLAVVCHARTDGGADLGADVADGGADGRADGQADVGAVASAVEGPDGRSDGAGPDARADVTAKRGADVADEQSDSRPDARPDIDADGGADADGVFPQADRRPDDAPFGRAVVLAPPDIRADVPTFARAHVHAGVLRRAPIYRNRGGGRHDV